MIQISFHVWYVPRSNTYIKIKRHSKLHLKSHYEFANIFIKTREGIVPNELVSNELCYLMLHYAEGD